jgi:diguanylate cyclase (GGDEF)-like protein/PAS domain S-box-containing protein
MRVGARQEATEPAEPGYPAAAAWHLAAQLGGFALFMMFVALVMGTNGAADWETWTDLMLCAIGVMGVVWSWRRRRVDGGEWTIVVVAFAAGLLAQVLISLRVVGWQDGPVPSAADLGLLLFTCGLIVYLVRRVLMSGRLNAAVHLLEAALMALSATFLLWEVVILPGLGDHSRLSTSAQVLVLLYPLLDLFLVSALVILLIIERSPARVAWCLGVAALVVGDAISGRHADRPPSAATVVAGAVYVIGASLVVLALVLPGTSRVEARRPTLTRLLAVNLVVTAALVVGVWQFVLHHGRATAEAVVLSLLIGIAWAASQIAGFYQSRHWVDLMRDNITEAERARAELRALLDDLPEAVVVLASSGRICEANLHALELTDRSREELLGHFFTELFEPRDRQVLVELWQDMREGTVSTPPTFAFHTSDGRHLLLEADANVPLRDPDRVVVALRDITERVVEAIRLEKARERFRLAFHNAPTGLALSTSAGGVIVDVNDSLVRMLARSRSELIGATIESITHPDDWLRHTELLRRAPDGESDRYELEKRYVRGDGEIVWARTWVSVMDDGEGDTLAIAHIEDVTEQRHSAERLEWAASHDGLTGLPNRFRFLERLGAFLEAAEPGSIAVLFIDIDNFKVINDSLGHDAGDQVVRATSERLRAVVRDRDMLGRFGGDEFIVMLRDVSGSYEPMEVAERLRAEIARPLIIDGGELFVTASIGITVSDREGVTTGEMLRDADAAMYRAKARGRDCVEMYAPGSHDATVLTLRTTNELRRGLERGEIVPYYQPIVQLGSGRLMGFEVLARWRHPDRGLLGPEQFLPMAEETGLIGDLGAAVLRQSLVQLGQWRHHTQRFSDLSLSVNLSARQLTSKTLVDEVSNALAEAGVSAGALWLEITETALMSDVKAATIALRELRSLGLHLSVDDFGTGYSSLTYLKRFPVEAIKVDRTFVNGLGIDAEDSTIVDAVVKLGHSLGLLVIAEGVETPLQLSRLRELGCDHGQGYLFGRPRPAELIESEYTLA